MAESGKAYLDVFQNACWGLEMVIIEDPDGSLSQITELMARYDIHNVQ